MANGNGFDVDLRDLSELERITVAIQNALGTIIRKDQARRLRYLPEDVTVKLDSVITRDDIDEDRPILEAPSEVQPIRGFKVLNPGEFSSGVELLVDQKDGKAYDLAETAIENLRAFKVWILNRTAQPGKTVKIRFYIDPYILGTLSPRLTAELVKVVDGSGNLVDFATETTLATLLTEATFAAFADISMSALRDALRGAANRTYTDLYNAITAAQTRNAQPVLTPRDIETTTPLGASASYTSPNVSVGSYAWIIGTVFADQAGTLKVQQSQESPVTNFDAESSQAYSANDPLGVEIPVVGDTYRVVFENGASAQGTFRLRFGRKSVT